MFVKNPRYPQLKGITYITGDKEQFLREYKQKIKQLVISEKTESKNLNISCVLCDVNQKHILSDLYKNKTSNSFLQTFHYIYHKIKKGIFVKIKDNKLVIFLPFTKKNFTNDWYQNISIDKKKYSSFQDIADKVSLSMGYSTREIADSIFWYANNFLIRYEKNVYETFHNLKEHKQFLEQLCQTQKVPDIEFFINKRDFPILKQNRTEPYESLFPTLNTPLQSHSYSNYLPILSMSTTKEFADIPIPTHDCWNTTSVISNISWDDKINKCVFRGSSTGKGTTIHNNIRLKLAYMDLTNSFLDVKITKWQNRVKVSDNQTLETIDLEFMKQLGLYTNDVFVDNYGTYYQGSILKTENGFSIIKLRNGKILHRVRKNRIRSIYYLSMEQQSKYKFILHVPGNVCAFRLTKELSCGCCILLVKSKYYLWYFGLLKPWIHYIPIKEDLSDLSEKIKWCQDNNEKCKQIAENAKHFYNQYLTRKNMLLYMKNVLWTLKSHTQIISKTNIIQIESNIQNRVMNTIQSHIQPLSIQLDEKDCIHRNSKSIVYCTHGSIYKIHKHVPYEFLIGYFGLNSLKIPNFVKTQSIFKNKQNEYILRSEYIKNHILFSKWIDNDFNWNIYIFILYQICIVLKYAFDKIGFMHWDLNPNNILLQYLEHPITIQYGEIYITSKIIPIIIDYDVSKMVYKGKHIGKMYPFQLDSCRDIYSLLITSSEVIYRTHKQYMSKIQQLLQFWNFNMNNSSLSFDTFLIVERKYETLLDKPLLKEYKCECFKKYLESLYYEQTQIHSRLRLQQTNKLHLIIHDITPNKILNSYLQTLNTLLPVKLSLIQKYFMIQNMEYILQYLNKQSPQYRLYYDMCILKLKYYYQNHIQNKSIPFYNIFQTNQTNSISFNIWNISEKMVIPIDSKRIPKIDHYIEHKSKLNSILSHIGIFKVNFYHKKQFQIYTSDLYYKFICDLNYLF